MDDYRAGGQDLRRRIGRKLPVSVKTALRDYIRERTFEKNIVAEGTEQPGDYARYIEKLDEDDRRKVLRDNALSLLAPTA